jgi:hypothetical protein
MADIEKVPVPLRDPMVHDLHIRVGRLEEHAVNMNLKTQEQSTELAVLKNDLGYVKNSVDGIQKGINRILWAIGLTAVAAATTFVLSGGLVIIQ